MLALVKSTEAEACANGCDGDEDFKTVGTFPPSPATSASVERNRVDVCDDKYALVVVTFWCPSCSDDRTDKEKLEKGCGSG
jgi:hypothetical protein